MQSLKGSTLKNNVQKRRKLKQTRENQRKQKLVREPKIFNK